VCWCGYAPRERKGIAETANHQTRGGYGWAPAEVADVGTPAACSFCCNAAISASRACNCFALAVLCCSNRDTCACKAAFCARAAAIFASTSFTCACRPAVVSAWRDDGVAAITTLEAPSRATPRTMLRKVGCNAMVDAPQTDSKDTLLSGSRRSARRSMRRPCGYCPTRPTSPGHSGAKCPRGC